MVELKIQKELHFNQFVRKMAELGCHDFTFKVTNGKIKVIGGCIKIGDGYELWSRRVVSVEDSRTNIKNIFLNKGEKK